MGVVGQQRETARTFFSLLKAYQKDSSLTNKLALNKFYENLVPVAEERVVIPEQNCEYICP